jgi:hypothetical protein
MEDWKNVIWTDETSVQLGGVRGKRRVWRKVEEAYYKHCIKKRWKQFKEFMFWGSFSYDYKGPCHIWEDETPVEKAYAITEIKRLNALKEDEDRAAWELKQQLKREAYFGLHGRRIGGKPAKWRHNKANGAYVREKGHGGIDWWRYQQTILIPLLIPFAVECMAERPGTVIQEDKVTCHASRYQHEVFSLYAVIRLLWPGNSPDLNAIELTWNWMKRKTTEKGCPTSKKQMKADWLKCWDEMPQSKIQDWVERIYRHVQEVILLEGGNEYKEGRCKGQLKKSVH